MQSATLHKIYIPTMRKSDGHLYVTFERLTSVKPCKKLHKAITAYSDTVILHDAVTNSNVSLSQTNRNEWRTIMPLSEHLLEAQITISYMGYMYYG